MQFAVAWQRVRQLQEEDVTLDAEVVGVNRGGILVDVANLRGFVPTSHVSVVCIILCKLHETGFSFLLGVEQVAPALLE